MQIGVPSHRWSLKGEVVSSPELLHVGVLVVLLRSLRIVDEGTGARSLPVVPPVRGLGLVLLGELGGVEVLDPLCKHARMSVGLLDLRLVLLGLLVGVFVGGELARLHHEQLIKWHVLPGISRVHLSVRDVRGGQRALLLEGG